MEPKTTEPTAKITQQFREAHNMTYELVYAGTPLILRMFPIEGPTEDAEPQWRIEARTSDAADAVVAKGTASSRAAAFESMVQWWRENTAGLTLASFDWDAVARALRDVRAI